MKLKTFCILCLFIFSFSEISAQKERFVKPVDEAGKDASFLTFRTKLITAAKNHDAKHILSIVDPNISNSFGGDDGLRYFKEKWKIENKNSKFWDEFLPVITNGGTFDKESGKKQFWAPYTFTTFPDDLDIFEYAAIFGNNVNLRAKPSTEAAVLGSLSYNVVKVDYDNSVKDGDDDEGYYSWLKVETLGGKKGFIKSEFVRGPVDYRAGFEKKNGQWKMIAFIAGD